MLLFIRRFNLKNLTLNFEELVQISYKGWYDIKVWNRHGENQFQAILRLMKKGSKNDYML